LIKKEQAMNTKSDITKTVGNTPLVHLQQASLETGAKFLANQNFSIQLQV